MPTYIALIRGINVGGKTLKMEALRKVFESLGCEEVRTYIQSGNVVFEHAGKDADKLEKMLEAKIEEDTGLAVAVVVKTPGQLADVVENNPYPADRLLDTDSVYVTFLKSKPGKKDAEWLAGHRDPTDELMLVGTEVYLLIHKSYGTTKLSNNFLEKKLKVQGTTRNWATTLKLLELSRP